MPMRVIGVKSGKVQAPEGDDLLRNEPRVVRVTVNIGRRRRVARQKLAGLVVVTVIGVGVKGGDGGAVQVLDFLQDIPLVVVDVADGVAPAVGHALAVGGQVVVVGDLVVVGVDGVRQAAVGVIGRLKFSGQSQES